MPPSMRIVLLEGLDRVSNVDGQQQIVMRRHLQAKCLKLVKALQAQQRQVALMGSLEMASHQPMLQGLLKACSLHLAGGEHHDGTSDSCTISALCIESTWSAHQILFYQCRTSPLSLYCCEATG